MRGLIAVGLALGAVFVLSSCSGSQHSGSAAAPDSGTISVEYSSTALFDTSEGAAVWWKKVKQEFEHTYPKATLNLVPIEGNNDDLGNKLAFDFHSSATAPDVAQLSFSTLGALADSDELLPLDRYAHGASFFQDFASSVRAEGTIQGHIYGISLGGNDAAILYNKDVFREAGISMPWQPKSWADLIAAAEQIKARVPNVTPFWTGAGTAVGPVMVARGPVSLLFGSSSPLIFDSQTGKWVVDSPGLRQLFRFYKTIYGGDLGPNASVIFDKTATAWPVQNLAAGKLGIAVGVNWWPGGWTMKGSDTYWPTSRSDAGIAALPTVYGQAPGTATMWTGYGYAVSKYDKDPTLAWGLIKIMESTQNEIAVANGAGYVPPGLAERKASTYLNFAPPFNAKFGEYLAYAKPIPTGGDYLVWAQGMEQATGLFARDAKTTSVDDAINMLRNTVVNQIGKDKVETLPAKR